MIALAVALLASLAPTLDGRGPAWRPVALGVEHLHLPQADAELLRFDLQRFALEVMVPGAASPVTAAQARAGEDAGKPVLAVNGGFFDTQGRPLGLRIARGKVVQGLRPRVDWGVLIFRSGRAAIVHSRDYKPDPTITAALQVGPRILVAGQVPPLKPQSARRTAVAVDATGRYVTFIVTRARVQASDLGQRLAALGFTHALMLDGGPSTQLSASIGSFTLEVEGLYPVPDLLLVLPAPP